MAGAATVEKALDVLFHLHGAGTSLGLTEIGRDLDLPKSSCHRLLASLVDRDVVERDEQGRYRPGLALLSLGLGAQAQEPVVRAARPALEAEAMALGETVFLVARRGEKLRVLDKCEGSGFLRAAPDVGDDVPYDVTAAGRIYRTFVDGEVGGADSNDSRAAADDHRVLERGYATNRDAWIEGLSVLAVPIWQERSIGPRDLVATLALGAASARFDELGETLVASRLLAAGETVSERLGSRRVGPRRARANSSRATTRNEEQGR
jgi:IclR family acetate operon transcriptional repressor